MDLHKVNVKFFVEKGADISLSTFVPVFHRWIQQDKLEGLLVDVTEYTHVFQGPGVLLIAQEANYSVDEAQGKRGMLYSQKRVPAKSAEEHLKTAFRRTLQAASFLEKEPEFAGKLKFAMNHFSVSVNDRLAAPHNAEAHEELEKHLKPLLNSLYDGAKPLLLPEKDPHKLTGFEVKMDKSADLATLQAKLNSN